jgi:molecular chaperone HscC
MIVGIDLGTTNSLIGIFTEKGPELIPNALGEFLTPSVISIDENDILLVGQAARDRLVTQPDRTVSTFKRWMGSARETRIGKRSFRPEELSAMVLKSLLADAEAYLGERVKEAVISVPAYFGDAQRKATRAAGEIAGIKVERLINEPTAAALSYALNERTDGSTFIVIDLGGGTFDVSILEVFEGVMQVHASAGDNHLGGEDFLDVIVAKFIRDQRLRRDYISKQDFANLLVKLERAKRTISNDRKIDLDIHISGKNYEWQLSESEFEQISATLLERIRLPVERAIRDSRLSPHQLSEVVLVGGASRMPIISKLASKMLGRLPLRHIDPDKAIALGACVAAGMKARNKMLEEVVMTDVCPYTLGVEVSHRLENGSLSTGHFSPIIERNCTVPISRSEIYSPVYSNQELLRLNVFQGESPMVANNIKLGELNLMLPQGKTESEKNVEVRFTYDVNGALQVEATVVSTGNKYEAILQNSKETLSDEEIKQRFKDLESIKIHPREDQENIALISRAERMYTESLGGKREQIHKWLILFLQEIEKQDRNTIQKHRVEFNKALDHIEEGVY